MKKFHLSISLFLLAAGANSQTISLISSDHTIITNASTQLDRTETAEVNLKFLVISDSAFSRTIDLEIQGLPGAPVAGYINSGSTLSKKISISITVKSATSSIGDTLSKRILIGYKPGKVALSSKQTALINISGETDFFMLLFDKPLPVKTPLGVILIEKTSDINPVISDTSTFEDKIIEIQIQKSPQIAKLDTVPRVVELILKSNTDSVKASLIYPRFELSAQEIKSLNDKKSLTKKIAIRVESVKRYDDSKHEFASLKIKGDTSIHLLHISKKNMWTATKPFWVEVGANLDLIDGLQANNFFAGVFVYKRDIRAIFSGSNLKDKPKRLGIFAGVFESKTLSNMLTVDSSAVTSSNRRMYFNNSSLSLNKNDSTGLFVDTGKVSRLQTVKNIGLFFSPQVRLSNGSSNADGIHFFGSFWAELQWQRVLLQNNFEEMRRIDTVFVPSATVSRYSPTEEVTEIDFRSHYFGFGAPLFYKDEYTNLFVNPVFGISNQPSSKRLEYKLQNPNTTLVRRWRPFYIIQFRLNEDKYGIAFTGEVRGLLIRESPPFVTLALSKKFDLAKFVEFAK